MPDLPAESVDLVSESEPESVLVSEPGLLAESVLLESVLLESVLVESVLVSEPELPVESVEL